MQIKHIIFFILLFAGVPIAAGVIKGNARLQKIAFFLVIMFIPFVYSTGINFFTDEFYKGTVRGYEVLAADLIALTILASFAAERGIGSIVFLPKGWIFYAMYFAFSAISLVNAANRVYSGYVLQQMILHYVFFVTVYNCLLRYKNFDIIFYALGSFIIFTFFHMLFQRLALGVYQPSGVFIHRNSTAMFSNMIAPIFLSYILNKDLTKRQFRFFFAAYLFSAFCVILSLSRGAIMFLPISSLIVVYFSLRNKVTARKLKILSAMGLLGICAFLRAAPMVIDRFENAPETSAEGRVAFAKAALKMANDKFFGVGLNNWGIKINPPYTYWEDTGIKRPDEDFKSGIVETIYLLVAAECGWIGFASLILWLGYYFVQNFLNVSRFKRSNGFFMAAGIAGSLVAVYGQSCFEWILKQQTNSYELMIIFAIVAAMTKSWQSYKQAARV
ncbi:MAG: O-antigen ligase family protein [Opitutales bacterium]|nr:O-antigen ligase family protein [Opitutales bacterium]